MKEESDWNWPLIIIFALFFGGMIIWMNIPEGTTVI